MDPNATQNRLKRFFSNPLVGIIGTSASLLGAGLAVFFYLTTQQTRELAAFLHPIRTTVAKTGQASTLSIKVQDRPVDSDVTALQITVWNRGTLSIRPENILKPVTILMPGTQVLQATITKQNRDVTNLRLDTTQLAQGRVPLHWDILERNDASIIQLIYLGDDNADIAVDGVLEGQPSVSLLKYPGKLQRSEDRLSRPTWVSYLLSTGACLYGSALLILASRAALRHRLPIWRLLMPLLIGLISLSGGVYGMYLISQYCDPPLGF